MNDFPDSLPDGRKCQQCKTREATLWVDNSGVLFHGFEQAWCEICRLENAIPNLRASVARLEELEARYTELTGSAYDKDAAT